VRARLWETVRVGIEGLIPDLYERHAHAWDVARGSRLVYELPWLDKFSALIDPGGHVLDVGCGSARPIAAHLIGAGYRLTGIDTAASLVALSRRRFPAHTWQVGDMRTLRLGRRFAGVVAWSSLFHLTRDDQRTMFGRFAAHLNPGGVLLFTSGHRDEETTGQFQGETLYHASLASSEYQQQLDDHGFDLVDHTIDDPAFGHLTIWLGRLRPRPGTAI
jgi:SAM-dependent methyltransferase